jgi:hypothetical protein
MSANVNVTFAGVCTNVRRDPKLTPWLSVPHRVVVVEARSEKKRGPYTIPKHDTFFAMEPMPHDPAHFSEDFFRFEKDRQWWRIEGARLRLEHAPQELLYHGSYLSCVPRLRQLDDRATASPAVVEEANVATADCYFDISGGIVRAGTLDEKAAVGTALSVLEATKLIVSSFADRHRVIEIPLSGATSMTLGHVAEECADDDEHHFLLHYAISGDSKLIGKPYAPAPGDPRCAPLLRDGGPFVSLGAGCSATDYP